MLDQVLPLLLAAVHARDFASNVLTDVKRHYDSEHLAIIQKAPAEGGTR